MRKIHADEMVDEKNPILLIFAFKMSRIFLFTPLYVYTKSFFLSFLLGCKKEYAHIH